MTPTPPPDADGASDEHAVALLAQLREERDAARDMLGRRTRFFVAASHDLRQPMHALGLLSQALQAHDLPADARDLVQRMGQAVTVLEGMFDELLDLSKMEARLLRPEQRPVQLQGVYDRVAVHAEPQAFDKGLALRWRGGRRWVQADPLLLERMLRNLVLNAIHYTEDGGVLVGVRRRGDGVGARWQLQVCDSGIGIAEDVLPHIFTPFLQAEETTPRHGALGPRGWGLGLAIVQRLAQAQGLAMGVRSVLGRGSVFTLELPLAAPAPLVPAPTSPRLTLAGHRLGVLVAHAALRVRLCELLTRWQADVVCHADLPLQLQAAGRPALLLTDQAGAARALGAAWQQPVPTILLGAASSSGDGDEVHALPLPLAPNRLRALIAYKLARPSA